MIYTARSSESGDAYLVLLSGVLLGYAIMGKGFAYLGLPPVYIGEIAFLTGIVIFWRTRCFAGVLTTLPALLLAATMAWVLLRTLPFIDDYGFDALRDSVVVMYGGFAFILIALLLEDRRRINAILRYYNVFLGIYVPVSAFILLSQRYMGSYIPDVPGTNIPLLKISPGDPAVHLCGAVVFALAGLRKVTPVWTFIAFASLTIVASISRGPLLAGFLPVIFAALVLGKLRELTRVFLIGLLIFGVAYAVEPAFTTYTESDHSEERPISTRQIIENVVSILGPSGQQQSEGTKEWRLRWWDMIIEDTVLGSHFWTGRGFGLNLGDADGFQDGDHPDLPPLRSPHNVHMTMLARAGVPGAALWFALIASWFVMIMQAMRTARRRMQAEWAGLFLFIGCYVMSIIINATFDVGLEGPMQGVWFWCLIGFGIGSVMVYRCQPSALPAPPQDR
jgi:O-Antigen ligase